jgi:hypothetical protein
MNKFFRIAFANSGDRTAVPDAVDPSGNVSYTEGYGSDYQLPKTDPDSKNIERDKMNDLFYEVTLALQELQGQGVPDFVTSVLNGGTAYSYSTNALVRYSGALYLSLANSNTAAPTDATKWALLPTAALLQTGAFWSASAGGTANALTATFSPAIGALGAQQVAIRVAAANTSATPTFAPDGLTAETIVKANNQPLAAGDLPGAGAWALLKRDTALGKWVLLNPAASSTSNWRPSPITASGQTALTFTGGSAGLRQLILQIVGLSTSGTSQWQIRVGSGSIQSSGYASASGRTNNANNSLVASYSAGFGVIADAASFSISGHVIFTWVSGTQWLASGTLTDPVSLTSHTIGGYVTLSGDLNQVSVTTVGGSDTFDAGLVAVWGT